MGGNYDIDLGTQLISAQMSRSQKALRIITGYVVLTLNNTKLVVTYNQ